MIKFVYFFIHSIPDLIDLILKFKSKTIESLLNVINFKFIIFSLNFSLLIVKQVLNLGHKNFAAYALYLWKVNYFLNELNDSLINPSCSRNKYYCTGCSSYFLLSIEFYRLFYIISFTLY